MRIFHNFGEAHTDKQNEGGLKCSIFHFLCKILSKIIKIHNCTSALMEHLAGLLETKDVSNFHQVEMENSSKLGRAP